MPRIEVNNIVKIYKTIEKEDGLVTLILPFAFVAYYPTMSYLGLNTYMIYLSPVVAIVLWVKAVKVWNWALNKYRSTGN